MLQVSLITQRLKAPASALLYSRYIKYIDHTARIADQAGGLQSNGSLGDGRAANAEHFGEEFLGQMDGVCFDDLAGPQ
jgi:hypothetical protein